MGAIYSPRPGAPMSKSQAERYGPELQTIADDAGGELTAEGVLEEASSPKSPLHDFFTWDDDEAARQYRLTQARLMIRSVEIQYIDSRGNVKKAKAFPSVAFSDERTEFNRQRSRYITAQRIFDEEDTREEVIEGFRRRINSLRRDMNQVEGMDDACRLLDDLDEELAA